MRARLSMAVSIPLVFLLLLAAGIAVAAVLGGSAAAQPSMTFTVDDTGDNTVAPYTEGQLRWAIDRANNTPPGPEVFIEFEVNMVLLNAQLPAITRNNSGDSNVTIDGILESGGRATVFQGAAPPSTGLVINAYECVVQNIIFQNFSNDGIYIDRSYNTLANVRLYRIGGNGICIESTGPDAEDNTVTACDLEMCATAAPGPAGGSGDCYGIKLLQTAGWCGDNSISTTAIYDCGDFWNGFGGGIGVFGCGGENTVDGCLIGTSNGISGDGNAAAGVTISDGAEWTYLGETARNVIIDNGRHGVWIAGAGTENNLVANNNIGLSAFLSREGNDGWGVLVEDGADDNTIGTQTATVANYIGDNSFGGIGLDAVEDTVVIGNAVGTDASLLLDRGNGGEGIWLSGCEDSRIGGPADEEPLDMANYVGYNWGNGIQVSGDSPYNSILVNLTTGNETDDPRLGIDIDPLADEPNDPATYVYQTPNAPNLYMPYPTIIYAAETEDEVAATGTAVPGSTVLLYYADDGPGFGQADEFIAAVTTNVLGNWHLDDTTLEAGEYITATATDTDGNTSEYAENFRVADEIPPTTGIVIDYGAEATNSRDVTLLLAAVDNLYLPTELEYQVSNYADFHDATWEPVPAALWTAPWTMLAGADGERTVYFRVRDPEFNIGSTFDTIYYKTTPPNGTVLINAGAPITNDPDVTLDLTANDTYYATNQLQVAVSNYADMHDATWQAFTTPVDWTLLGGTGNRTVYVRYRDPLGNTSGNFTDTIFLDEDAPTGSVAFKGGAQSTATPDVELVLTVHDDHFSPSQCQMQVSNNSDFSGATWQPFKANLAWTLLAGSGDRTVYARFRDAAGNVSVTYSASIYLEAGAGSTWYLAEGTNAWGFTTYITIQNPNINQVTARITYMTPDTGAGKGTATRDVVLPPTSQTTIDPSWDVTNSDFSTKVQCLEGELIAVDRTMLWNASGTPGGHSSIGVVGASRNWYLAEGSSNWGFETWVLVQNPNTTEATVNLTYMIENEGPVNVTKKVPASSRATFSMVQDIGNKDASIQVASNLPVIAERAQYFDERREGTESIGAVAAAKTFYLAEGTSAWGFMTYVLVQNPNPVQADVNVTFMTPDGPVAMEPFSMPAQSRETIRVNEILPDTDFSTRVEANVPIVAERAMYWETEAGDAAHCSIGLTAPHGVFFLPDGQCSEGWETYVLVQNPNAADVTIRITMMYPNGDTKTIDDVVPANSRRTYNLANYGATARCATMVMCISGQQIMCERAMYANGRATGAETVGGWSD